MAYPIGSIKRIYCNLTAKVNGRKFVSHCLNDLLRPSVYDILLTSNILQCLVQSVSTLTDLNSLRANQCIFESANYTEDDNRKPNRI